LTTALYRRFYSADPRAIPLIQLCSEVAQIKAIHRMESGAPPDLRELALQLANERPNG
jgi:hypothetical protein